jgi:hypothetical protein
MDLIIDSPFPAPSTCKPIYVQACMVFNSFPPGYKEDERKKLWLFSVFSGAPTKVSI